MEIFHGLGFVETGQVPGSHSMKIAGLSQWQLRSEADRMLDGTEAS